MGCKIVVVGGSGFIGLNLVKLLEERFKGNVYNIDIKPATDRNLSNYIQCDINNPGLVVDKFKSINPNIVFHLAARTDLLGKNPSDYLANTVGVYNVVRAVNDLPSIKKVVYLSSMLVCKLGYYPKSSDDFCPNTAYGASKAETEKIIRKYARHNNFVILRPTSIWGPHQGVPYNGLFKNSMRGLHVNIAGSYAKRTFGYVENITAQMWAIVNDTEWLDPEKMYYLGDVPPISIRELSDKISIQFRQRPCREVPLFCLKCFARVGDLASRFRVKFPITSFRLQNVMTDYVVDLSNMYRYHPKEPIGIDQGVRRTIDWIKKI